jgi:hypothetical protein
VTSEHPNLGPELRQLAQTVLVLLDPLIQAASALVPSADAEPGKCQQVWCPVCAVAAVAEGETHPLATLLAEHGAALLTLVRAMLDPDQPDPPRSGPEEPPDGPGKYQPIPVTIFE